MYKARYVSSGGQEFNFSFDNGVIFDIAPLSGVPGTVNTSQGYEQVGETYTSVTIGGLQRTINGKILKNVGAIKKALSNVFIPQSTGKLYFNENYYCDCVVKTTPEYGVGENYRNFYVELYCPYPYWLSSAEVVNELGGYTPAFRFPVNYAEPHTFGVKNPTAFINCQNSGVAKAPYRVRFYANAEVVNYGIVNAYTFEYLKIFDTLKIGEEVNVYRENGVLRVEKTFGDTTESIFSKLDEDSTLLYMPIGENPINATADSGLDSLVTLISFSNSYSEVHEDGN